MNIIKELEASGVVIPKAVRQQYLEEQYQDFPNFFWQSLFTYITASEKVVNKVWGFELHLFNSSSFCAKKLVFWGGGKLSLHKHFIKEEIFINEYGLLGLILNKDDKYWFPQGSKVHLLPGTYHSLVAFSNAIVSETSTEDRPEDNDRLIESSYNENQFVDMPSYLSHKGFDKFLKTTK